MPRKIFIKKRFPQKDYKFDSFVIASLLNKLLKRGKKTLAQSIINKSFDIIEQLLQKKAEIVFEKAIRNISPRVSLQPKYIGNKTVYVPILLNRFKSTVIAVKWLVDMAKKRKKYSIHEKIAAEIIDAYKGAGGAMRKREEMHKMAEANKAFLSLDENKEL